MLGKSQQCSYTKHTRHRAVAIDNGGSCQQVNLSHYCPILSTKYLEICKQSTFDKRLAVALTGVIIMLIEFVDLVVLLNKLNGKHHDNRIQCMWQLLISDPA